MTINSGLKPREIFGTNATALSIQKRLGKPISAQTFSPPMEITKTNSWSDTGMLSVEQRNGMASLREDYRYRGYVVDPVVSGGYGMALAMTWGFLEIFTFPSALVHRIAHARDLHFFQVWYDQSGVYIASDQGPLEASLQPINQRPDATRP